MAPMIWWQQLALVMAGGALGAAGRFWLSGSLLRQLGYGFPWGTLAVNLLGSLLAGFLMVWLEGRGPSALYWRAFLLVGILGGLTTFSALMVECLLFAKSDRNELMLLYVGVSLIGGLLAIWLGTRLGQACCAMG
ncbi:MAG: fluoride efflux transporter CrcB [Pseudoxanthomonas sp.]